MFSVRSAYHIALSLFSPASSSGAAWDKNIWRNVWKANIPNKAKVFIWWAIRDILPTANNLTKRLSHEAFRCPFCGSETETPIHVFLHCSFARQVWALSHISWSDIDTATLSLETWISIISVKLSVANFNLVVMICWTIWWSRNLKLAHKEFLLPFRLLNSLEAIFLPSCRKIKSLCLLGLLDGGRAIGLGIIARDATGLCLAWSSIRLNKGGSAELAEALAAREAIRLAHRFCWLRIILEGDCLTLVQQLSSDALDFSVISPLVMDVKFFSTLLTSVSFSFVKRCGNSAADLLAGCALNQEGIGSCLPPGLESVLLADLVV
ncbi:UNVERIFIED_CONTAM: hypothetical protein Slati_3241100 [Sesamum latifolium]|uniref:Reverse transcriptase zinc-binding domain-containing protein n=1 Tax=Sesamum latifolium TaxID=2727402 RepID=A0AAW2UZ73_9LAMI